MESVVRAAVIYLFLLLVFRLAGKRSLHEATTFDLVLLLVIGEATQQALLGPDYSITNACVVISTLVGLEILFSWLQRVFPVFGRALDSLPLVILEHGRPIPERMRRERVSEEDILAAARLQRGLSRLDQIACAVLEREGHITVIAAEPDRL